MQALCLHLMLALREVKAYLACMLGASIDEPLNLFRTRPSPPASLRRHVDPRRDPDMAQVRTSYCGTEQPQHSDALAAADKRLLKKDGEPRARDGAPLPLLQFRPHA